MSDDKLGHELERALESLRAVPPPDVTRQAAGRAAFLSQARQMRRASIEAQQGRKPRRPILLPMRFGPFRKMLAIMLALSTASTGVAFAADGAGPGDALYGVDMAIEQARLKAAPNSAAELHIAFAGERLEEATDKAADGDLKNADAALQAYGNEIAAAAGAIGGAGGADAEELAALLDAALSIHETQLEDLLASAPQQAQQRIERALEASQNAREHAAQGGRPEDRPGGGPPEDRPGGDPPEDRPGGDPPEHRPDGDLPEDTLGDVPHDDLIACTNEILPEAVDIANEYGVNVADVMELHCRGIDFEQIPGELGRSPNR